MPGTLLSLQKRLTKAEQKMADVVRRWESANCKCKTQTIICNLAAFERELEPCPVHGFRRLGKMMVWILEDPVRVGELQAIYDARLAEAERLKAEDSDES